MADISFFQEPLEEGYEYSYARDLFDGFWRHERRYMAWPCDSLNLWCVEIDCGFVVRVFGLADLFDLLRVTETNEFSH